MGLDERDVETTDEKPEHQQDVAWMREGLGECLEEGQVAFTRRCARLNRFAAKRPRKRYDEKDKEGQIGFV